MTAALDDAIAEFGAGPRAYARLARLDQLPYGDRQLVLIYLAQRHSDAFDEAMGALGRLRAIEAGDGT